MPKLEQKIEAILLYKNEPVSLADASKLLGATKEDVGSAILELQKKYADRGLVIVSDGEQASFGTHPNLANLIETMAKEERSADIGRAGLETLAIVLYKGPVSRREIDYIRGVNSGFILRNLLVRGLVERVDVPGERSFGYKSTLALQEHLGVDKLADLPEYKTARASLAAFAATESSSDHDA